MNGGRGRYRGEVLASLRAVADWLLENVKNLWTLGALMLPAIWDSFKEHGIQIPYPHRHLLVTDPIPVETRQESRPGSQ